MHRFLFNSFVWYGPFWAQASTAPSRLMKGFSTQGGIRVPFIIHYPPFHGHPSSSPGSIIRQSTTVMDIAATVLDVAGIEHPVKTGESSGLFRGREVVGMKGKTWTGIFNKGEVCHDESEPLGWEVSSITLDISVESQVKSAIDEDLLPITIVANIFSPQLHGRAGIRLGNWKLTFVPPPFGPGKWQLYDLQNDPGEVFDLKDKEPERYKEMSALWDKYVEMNGVIWGAPMPSETIDGDDIIKDPVAWMKSRKV